MNPPFDMVIKNGLIVDGSGGSPFRGDVAIRAGKIEAVGDVRGESREVIDATNHIVTPGFVDIHTHYDGQVTWESTLKPSTSHGVTTVVMGNCGVGFAPCRPTQRDMLVKVMEGVEDIPEIVLTAGIPWKWESFAEYLDFLSARQYDVDCAAYVPHAAIRVYVMGERAAAGQLPTQQDLSQMTELVAAAVRAGAVGVATSRTLMHCDSTGAPAPHVKSERDELLALARGLRLGGGGTFQVVPRVIDLMLKGAIAEPDDPAVAAFIRQEVALLQDIAETSGGPVSYSLTDVREAPGLHMAMLRQTEALNDRGLDVRAQVFPRPIGLLVGLELTLHPFKHHPSYVKIAHLPLATRVERLRDPSFRRQLLSEQPDPSVASPVQLMLARRCLNAYQMGDHPNYNLDTQPSVTHEAARRQISTSEVALEWLLENDGHAILFAPAANFTGPNLDSVLEMLEHRDTLIGLGDGGAHCGALCDASYPTTVLSYWVRDRVGSRLQLAQAVAYLSRRNALAIGLKDRGLIAPGMKADLNVIQFDKLNVLPPEVAYDLPAQGRRVLQRAEGYAATLINGIITRRNDQPTGATPGRLVRRAAA